MRLLILLLSITLFLSSCNNKTIKNENTAAENMTSAAEDTSAVLPSEDIKLDFKPYSIELTDKPGSIKDKTNIMRLEINNLFGHDVIFYQNNNWTEESGKVRFAIYDKFTDELLYSNNLKSIYQARDLDKNGDYELYIDILHDDDYNNRTSMIVAVHSGQIEIANMTDAFHIYLSKLLSDDVDYDDNCFFTLGDYPYFTYTLHSDRESAYTTYMLSAVYTGNGFVIEKDRKFDVDLYAPFQSNNPNWTTEVSYYDIPYPDGGIYQAYMLTLCGPNDVKYEYTEDELKIDKYADIKYDRKLVIHPTLNYAIIICPLQAETDSDITQPGIYLIDLKTGELKHTVSPFLMINDLYGMQEQAFEVLYELDYFGYTSHYLTADAIPTEAGFRIRASLWDLGDNLVNSTVTEMNLTD